MTTHRRGFLGRLLGRRPFRQGCFALQLVLHADGMPELRGRLHALIDGPTEEDPAAKRRYYKQLSALLREAEPFFEYGAFVYDDDERSAAAEFETWVSEIEAGMATEEGELGEDVDGHHRLDHDKRYIVVSLVFLLTKPHPFHEGLDHEDDEAYTRPRMAELVDSINLFDFAAGVEADATFLVPGSEQDGFSWSDLADEGWEHLHLLHSGSSINLDA